MDIDGRLVRVKVSQFHMGMMVHLTVWADSTEQGRGACAAAFQRIGEINMIMSDYEPDSELSRLCRRAGQGAVPVSDELFEVLAAARHLAELTDGLYDPTVAPVSRLWREARRSGQPPDEAALENALALVGYENVILDARNRTVELAQCAMLIDLGSIAKGYAGDEALKILRQHGLTRAVFEAGGDKVLGDPPPATDGWLIEPDHPAVEPLRLSNCAVSVSGDTVQYFEINGHRYSHVIDPRTGKGIATRQWCMTVAPQGVTSDPLATIGTMMDAGRFKEWLARYYPGVRAQVLPAPSEELPQSHVPPPLSEKS